MTTVEIAPNPDLLSFLTPISVGLGFRPTPREADQVAELLSQDRSCRRSPTGPWSGPPVRTRSGLPALLGPACRQRDLALGLVISRVVAPASKLATLGWWA